jgi:hypothetical protein
MQITKELADETSVCSCRGHIEEGEDLMWIDGTVGMKDMWVGDMPRLSFSPWVRSSVSEESLHGQPLQKVKGSPPEDHPRIEQRKR